MRSGKRIQTTTSKNARDALGIFWVMVRLRGRYLLGSMIASMVRYFQGKKASLRDIESGFRAAVFEERIYLTETTI